MSIFSDSELLKILEVIKKQQDLLVVAGEIIDDLNNRLVAVESYIAETRSKGAENEK